MVGLRGSLDKGSEASPVKELTRFLTPLKLITYQRSLIKIKNMNFSFKTMIWKGIKYFIIFAIPFLVNQFIVAFPQIAQLTVGALLVMLVNWIKIVFVKFGGARNRNS